MINWVRGDMVQSFAGCSTGCGQSKTVKITTAVPLGRWSGIEGEMYMRNWGRGACVRLRGARYQRAMRLTA